MADVLAERRKDRDRMRSLAAEYVERLARRRPIRAAALVGSVARGDFNLWSDIDVVVIAEALPERLPDRALALVMDAPAGVQPIGFTPTEFERAYRRRDPLAREAVELGQTLRGEPFFSRFRVGSAAPTSPARR